MWLQVENSQTSFIFLIFKADTRLYSCFRGPTYLSSQLRVWVCVCARRRDPASFYNVIAARDMEESSTAIRGETAADHRQATPPFDSVSLIKI